MFHFTHQPHSFPIWSYDLHRVVFRIRSTSRHN